MAAFDKVKVSDNPSMKFRSWALEITDEGDVESDGAVDFQDGINKDDSSLPLALNREPRPLPLDYDATPSLEVIASPRRVAIDAEVSTQVINQCV